MIHGLYLSAQGARQQSFRLDTLANNLANAETGAFKRDLAVFRSHRPQEVRVGRPAELPEELENATGGTSPHEVVTDFSNGSLVRTGGTYDVALSGPGFLRVADGNDEFLTRNGRLTVNDRGELVTLDSNRSVLSERGRTITIPSDARDVEIGTDGTILRVDANGARSRLGRLDLVHPESTETLQKVGDSFYRNEGAVFPAGDEVQVRQGFLEASGVQPVQEMMELIEASRAFESNVNLIRMQDDALGRLLGSVGRR